MTISTRRIWRTLFTLTLFAGWLSPHGIAAELDVEVDERGATVTIDGELFTRYVPLSGNRPVLYPVIGPTGAPVTRAYPIEDARPHEARDHIHHRSLWFGYEGINGINFWHEPEDLDQPAPIDGRQVHREFVTAEKRGDTVLLVTRTDYVDGNGKRVAEDERTLRFGTAGESRWIDYTIKLRSPEGPLKIGDTKEGAFAVRVAGTMKVDANLGGKIVNSNGQENAEAWGQPAEWVDYHGPVEGETVGIAILAHPSSLKAKPRWHVRTYGLFASNPIGARDYSGGEEVGGLEVPEGQPIVLRHKVLIHPGDHQSADIAGAYQAYAESE